MQINENNILFDKIKYSLFQFKNEMNHITLDRDMKTVTCTSFYE